jgi:hypothetical protein
VGEEQFPELRTKPELARTNSECGNDGPISISQVSFLSGQKHDEPI